MSSDVRLDYCRLWQSILRRDEAGMKEHSRRLGIEKMYPLFICIVTGRSWDAVTQGVDQTAVSKSEVMLTDCFMLLLGRVALHRVKADCNHRSFPPTIWVSVCLFVPRIVAKRLIGYGCGLRWQVRWVQG